jgi:plasmid replication initiation protein
MISLGCSQLFMKEKLIFVDSNGTIILIAKGKGADKIQTYMSFECCVQFFHPSFE